MAVDTILQVRIDKKTKDDVEKLYRSLGLTFASAVRLFTKQSLVEQGMPFVVTKKPTNATDMLNKYADKSKRRLEKETVERCLVDKHRRKN